jgi:membrane-bound lytic murein transglycosylase D
VAYYVDLYGERNREQFKAMLGMADHYFPLITSELAQAGLPAELKYLPMALSGMNTLAGSTQGEAGLWMLTYPVAVRQGLTISAGVDERRDPLLATMAAIAELERLRTRFPGPDLFLLAAACGPANVERALVRSKGAKDLGTLYQHVDPAQRDVLPLLMAFIHLAMNAGTFGINPIPAIPFELADTVRTTTELRPADLANCMDLSLARLTALNPTLFGRTWPAHATALLPQGCSERFIQCITQSVQDVEQQNNDAGRAPQPKDRKAITYRVRPGDNLGSTVSPCPRSRHGTICVATASMLVTSCSCMPGQHTPHRPRSVERHLRTLQGPRARRSSFGTRCEKAIPCMPLRNAIPEWMPTT